MDGTKKGLDEGMEWKTEWNGRKEWSLMEMEWNDGMAGNSR